MISLFGLDPGDWEPHALHSADRAYAETNCYADVMIELIAAAGHEPEAALGITAAMDFEQDQWTFFKPAQEDMFSLYGMDLHEMQPFRNLAEQAAERLTVGQTLVPELDSFWLPDTVATSYRTEHVKTSVVVEAIDVDYSKVLLFRLARRRSFEVEDHVAPMREAWTRAMSGLQDLAAR